ncbi:MAG: hypothetical protein LBV47_07700 [Bacteroidales bacterium]|nr:hypothetical protein [Bacteroidales bacterium]
MTESGKRPETRRHILRTALTAVVVLFAFNTFAADMLTLTNEMVFNGKITRIKNCMVTFRASDGNKYTIPANDIFSIQFEDMNDKVYTNYMQDMNSDKCMKGTLDAEYYHGKKGGHFVLGVLFGPFAMIGTAVSNPSPWKGKYTYMMSENKDNFNDLEYLSCYKKKAKGQLIGMEGLGWVTWILLVVI